MIAVEIDGATGALVALDDGPTLRLELSRAFAPGQPFALRLCSDPPLALSAKAIGSQRLDEATFTVRARVLNLRRADRATLLGLFRPQELPGS